MAIKVYLSGTQIVINDVGNSRITKFSQGELEYIEEPNGTLTINKVQGNDVIMVGMPATSIQNEAGTPYANFAALDSDFATFFNDATNTALLGELQSIVANTGGAAGSLVGHLISADETGNSTKVLLGSGATYTGAWEDVTSYSMVAVAIKGSIATDGVLWIDASMDGGVTIINSVPYTVSDASFFVPKPWNVVESHIRIRYVNGTTAQTGFFGVQTKYSNAQSATMLSVASGTIRPEDAVALVKSVATGRNPSGDYINSPAAGKGFSTTALLGNGATYSSGVLDSQNYTQVQTHVLSDKDGTLTISFYEDSAGTDLLRTLSIPYTGGSGFKMFSAPAFTPYVKYEFTCNEVGQSDFYYDTKFLTGALSGQVLGIEDFIASGMVTNLGRNVQVGLNPDGVYINNAAPGIDANNTTSALLGISGIFTGAWSRVDLYGEIKVAMHTDVESASCLLQLSHDGVAIDTSLSLPPQLNTAGLWSFIHSLNPSLPYFRVVYTNGATAQTDFNLTTTYLVQSGHGFVSRTTQVIDKFTDARVVRQANDPTLDRNLNLLNYQKSIRKFGKNNSVANSAFETVWSGAQLGGSLQYVFATSAQTIRIKAGGNAADTAAGLGVQKITVDGLDENWNEISVDIVTAGSSASAATTELFYAVNKVYSKEVGVFRGTNTGNIIIENTTTGTELAYVAATLGTTEQCVYTVPAGKTAYITKIRVSVGQSDSADVRLEHIENGDDITGTGGTFTSAQKVEWEIEDFSGARDFKLDTYLKFDEKNHIYFEAQRITGSGTAQVSVDFEMYLITN
jgi:hypothetical protein